MKIGILGAGAEGSAIAALLVQESDVESVRLADLDERRLSLAVNRVSSLDGHCSVEGALVDGTRMEEVSAWSRGVDIVVNSSFPPTNLPTMRSCLEIGAHYLDLFAYPFPMGDLIPYSQTIDAQVELSEQFSAAGLVAISCAGLAPGWVDLVARYISETLDTIDSMTVRWAEWNDGKELITPFAPSLILTFNMPQPIAWHEGGVVNVDPLEGEELYEWPPPLGVMSLYTGFLHPELRTVQNIGRDIRHIEVKSGLSNGRWKSSRDIWVEALRRQLSAEGLANETDLSRRLGRSFIPPEDYQGALKAGIVTAGVIAVSVEGRGVREDHDIVHTVYLFADLNEGIDHIPWGTHNSWAVAGTTPITLVTMLGRGEISDRGVVGVGALSQWRLVLKDIAHRGFRMTEHIAIEGKATF